MYNVIVVDDDRILRKNIINSIRWSDFLFNIPFEAANGREGLELILKIVPDLVLTDICMPLIDGITLIKTVREKYKDMKFIVLSNYSDYEYLRGAVRVGAVDYLLKCNITPQDIKSSLRSMNFKPDSDSPAVNDDDLLKCTRPEIIEAIMYIRENYDRKMTLSDIARHVNVSQSHFCRLFKQELGYNFVDYLNELRISNAKQMLQSTNLRISEISEKLGFSNCDYFSRVFCHIEGVMPSEYRKIMSEKK